LAALAASGALARALLGCLALERLCCGIHGIGIDAISMAARLW